jgi:hypothetical protein
MKYETFDLHTADEKLTKMPLVQKPSSNINQIPGTIITVISLTHSPSTRNCMGFPRPNCTYPTPIYDDTDVYLIIRIPDRFRNSLVNHCIHFTN